MGSGKYWKRHYKFYGYKSKDIQTIILHETYDLEEMKILGPYYSKLFNVVESDLWANLMEENGVDGGPHSEAALLKISISSKGRVKSEVTRKKLSESLKGRETSPEHRKNLSKANTGKKLSPERIKRLREVNTGRKVSPETLEKKRLSMLGKPSVFKGLTKDDHPGIMRIAEARKGSKANESTLVKKSKPVLQYSLSGEFIQEWFGISEAGKQLGINRVTINSCCQKKKHNKSAGGFIWKYKLDDEENHIAQ